MNIKQDTGNCYVFSQATLELALQEWLNFKTETNPEKEESFQITAAALPWFLKHLGQSSAIYMFTSNDFLKEMKAWKSSQLNNYPQQKIRIEETCDQLINFFESDIVTQHKMVIEA